MAVFIGQSLTAAATPCPMMSVADTGHAHAMHAGHHDASHAGAQQRKAHCCDGARMCSMLSCLYPTAQASPAFSLAIARAQDWLGLEAAPQPHYLPAAHYRPPISA